jgi:integrase
LVLCSICRQSRVRRIREGRKTAIAFHAFRHTCASLLFAEGRNLKQVAEWLGHADPAFTLTVYVDLLDEGLGGGLELRPFDGGLDAAARED